MIGALLEKIGGCLMKRPPVLPPEGTTKARGDWGEAWAAWHYYRQRGAAILARNWRGGGGELDLVAREDDTLVFIEVKTRNPDDPDPLSAVRDDRRQRHFRAAADAYWGRLPRPRPVRRYDVVLVTPRPDKPNEAPQIDCLVDVLGE